MSCEKKQKARMWNYAVVQFLADLTYSEIPITWIQKDDSQCWWPPRTSNCPQMIANCESPDCKTWATHKINVVKLCTSLESARKHAADAQYQTTDEERLGRGKRQHVPYNRFSSDPEESSTIKHRKYIRKKPLDIVMTSRPPSCPENLGSSQKEANREYEQGATSQQAKRLKTNNTGVAKPLSHPKSSKSFNKETNDERNKMSQQGHGNVNTSTVCRNKSPLLFDDREPSDVERNDEHDDEETDYEYNSDEYNSDEYNSDEYNSDEYNNDESNNEEHNNDEIPTSQVSEQDNKSSSGYSKDTWQDVTVINSLSPLVAQQALQQKNNDIYRIKRSLQRLLRMQAKSNLTLKDVRERQINLEKAIISVKSIGLNPVGSDDSLIVELLPLATVDNMKEFDSLLKTSNEAVTQFKQFLLKIGGNGPRDNIHRILKKIFSNGCAVNCSWKGVRKNFRLDNLHFIKMIRRHITSHHSTLTESEFDNIAAEWIRFAKQRKTREEKEKDKENKT
ncbi:uncharacterized protein [Temnothorax nylanderi]|uniref:uncharacterized protein n=1 Tax=Temnothorax nylanderi TaxID=102681 RepID=UPI003A83F852